LGPNWEVLEGSWLDAARLRHDSLFQLLNLIQVGTVLFLDVLGNILCCNVRSCPLAPFVAVTFHVKSWAHDGVFEFCEKVGGFALKLPSGFSFLHFELRNLVFIFDQAKSFHFSAIFVLVFIAGFALSFAAMYLFFVWFLSYLQIDCCIVSAHLCEFVHKCEVFWEGNNVEFVPECESPQI
jgi:hypothetical protein